MRVAIDSRYLNGKGSGIGSYVLCLIKALLAADQNLELLLIGAAGQKIQASISFGQERVAEIAFPGPPNFIQTQFLMRHFLRGQRYDLFHSPFAVVPVGLDRPLVVTIHDIMWMVNPRFISKSWFLRSVAGPFFRQNLKAALRSAQRVLTISQATANAIVEHEPWFRHKVRVTPHGGPDRERIVPIPRDEATRLLKDVICPADSPFVLTVGDASPHKNHYNAVAGFLEAFRLRPEYRMVLVRRFSRHDHLMRTLLSTEQARRQVIVLPHVSQEVVNALYNAARIFLFPSYYEGLGLPPLEAMVTHTPVVSSKTSAMPEVAGDAALLIDPSDPHAIARALIQLDTDENLRETLIQRGNRRLEDYSWERCAAATLDIYRELVG